MAASRSSTATPMWSIRANTEASLRKQARGQHPEAVLQALARRPAGAQRRLAADQLLLERALSRIQQCVRERRPVAEAAEQGALAHARVGCDVVHRHVGQPALLEQTPRRAQDLLPVAR